MNVLVTGVSSGIGKSTAELFLKNNHCVYGIDINNSSFGDNYVGFLADITNKDSLEEVYSFFVENDVKLDLIINVAGVYKMASFVESDYNKMHNLIDVNLLGPILVNRVFHNLLDAKGKIIVVTSEVAYLDPMPFNGLYGVSKTALDCYCQALRQEVGLLGQKVITIRPGAVATPLCDNSLEETKKLASETKLFKKQSKKFLNLVKKFMGTPLHPDKVAEVIYKAGSKSHPKLVYKIHRNFGLVLLNILPLRLQCFIIKMLLK